MRVAITGIGIISPIGTGWKSFWKNALDGKSGIRKITEIDTSQLRSQIAGFCDDFIEDNFFSAKDIQFLSKTTRFALAATQLCLEDARLKIENITSNDFGCYVGTSQGGMMELEKFFYDFWIGDRSKRDVLILPKVMENSMAANIAIRYGLRGPNITINTACSSSTNAIGYAYYAIKNNEIRLALAGGVDVISPSEAFFDAWDNTRILSTYNSDPEKACRPFAKSRNGTVIAEGSCFLLLENLRDALERGAKIYAELIGYASNCDADNLLSPNRETQAEAIRKALRVARIKPEDIDYINSHGTGTQLNDIVETEVIKSVFKKSAYRIPINSTKSLIGHTMGASGAIESAVVALSISGGIVHPTINYLDKDPLCDLDYVPNKKRSVDINYAINNSFGMGGNNAVLIFKKHRGNN